MNNKILVVGGLHGNEKLGLELVGMLKRKPIAGVEALIANPCAVKANARFTESDMNRSFGNAFAGTYETRRAQWLKKKAAGYDRVLDFHNTQALANNCCFVGESCQPELYQTAKNLHLTNCIQADYDCINKVCPNTLSIEISIGDRLDNAAIWYERLKTFSLSRSSGELNIYTYLQRVTWEEKEKLGIEKWQPFQPISQRDKNKLGISGIIVPIFVGSTLTPYWATLLTLEGVR